VVRSGQIQNGTFRNASAYVPIVPSSNVTWYDTDIYSQGFKLANFTGTVTVDYSSAGFARREFEATGFVLYYNETKYGQDEVRFYVAGSGTLRYNLTGLQASWQYNKYVDGLYVTTVVTDDSGRLSDSVALSSHEVVYLPAGASGGGGGTGGGTGGGGGPVFSGGGTAGPTLKYCDALNISVPADEWSEALCEPGSLTKIRKAKIMYVTHDSLKKRICPFFNLSTFRVSECIETRLKTGETVYIGGVAFSAVGRISPQSYTWFINGEDIGMNSPDITYVFRRSGEYNITLMVTDSRGTRYYDSVVVKASPDIEMQSLLGLLLNKLTGGGQNESNRSLVGAVSNLSSAIVNKTNETAWSVLRRTGLTKTEAAIIGVVIVISLYAARRVVFKGG